MMPARPTARARLLGGVAAIVVFVALATACLWDYYPPLASHLRLLVDFGEIELGTSQPLIVSGQFESGDFLYVRGVDAGHVVFGYDSWGTGGPVSQPVTIARGTHTVDLVLPALATVRGYPPDGDRLQVTLDRTPVLDAAVATHARKPMRLWFGRNPIGGSACGATFRGRIQSADGQSLEGGVRALLSRSNRVAGWLTHRFWQVLAIVLLAWGAGWSVTRLATMSQSDRRGFWERGATFARTHRAFAASAAVCVIAFAWVVTCGSWRLFYEDSFGVFYDFQAQSFLAGRLDVPGESLSGEAFVAHGKIYGYFGITPALLRLPFAALGIGFGVLTRPSLLVAFGATLCGAYAILRQIFRTARLNGEPGPVLTSVYVLNVGLGSTAFFLSSRAYVYHEAIAWGIAFATWACWFGLRQLEAPERRAWIGALVCGALSVHARPPVGLYALTFLGVVAAFLAFRQRRQTAAALRHLLIGASTVLGVLSFNGVSYLKFGTIEGCPLRMNVQYTPERLAHIDGKQFHAVNIPLVFATYFVAPGVGTTPRFPWIAFTGAKLKDLRAKAKMDMMEPTGSIPAVMTGLTLLALVGLVAARPTRTTMPVAVTWLAAIPVTLALCAAIATSQRYTGDFLPFLITAGAIGAAGLALARGILRRLAWGVVTLASVWSIATVLALTLRFQGEMVWGQPDGVQARYQAMRQQIDGWFGSGRR